ncbi:hypothetical protein FACS189459_7140 [Bacilli bacterium]|nr:hypothetical protein FACS189459_7140 [Bacilli bacterium]
MLDDLLIRDKQDCERELCPLIKVFDAVEINTDDFTSKQVVEQIIKLLNDRINK